MDQLQPGQGEQPPVLTDEDDEILDAIWDLVGEEREDEEDAEPEGKKGLPFGGRTNFDPVVKDQADRGADDFPGDRPDDHEDNTFGLPEGVPLRRELRKWFRRIAREVLGTVPTIGAPVPTEWPAITDWEDPMATAMTPILSAYWDEAGKVTRERLGLDPDEWRVVDPHVHDKIVQQSHNFCESTLSTTTHECRTAYDLLKRTLAEGVVEQGEAYAQLTKRVQAIFQTASKSKAEQIARTETARAVNAASLQSAADSGVVARKKWLLSANACPQCHEVADRVNAAGGVPLGEPFASGLSEKAEYATCQAPPLHPSCRCTTTLVLTEEYQRIVDEAKLTYGPMGVAVG